MLFFFFVFIGITGEKNVYRRRGEKEPEVGAPQTKPKRLRLVVDVSGSMYRYIGCLICDSCTSRMYNPSTANHLVDV